MTGLLLSILGVFVINTAGTSLVIDAVKGGNARIIYYGTTLAADEAEALKSAGYKGGEAYPAYGMNGTDESALAVTLPDGNQTLDLKVTEVSEESWENGKVLTITSKDTFYPVTTRIFYKSYYNEDMIETWVEIDNGFRAGKKDGNEIILTRYFSGCLPIREGDVWASTIYGKWGNEGRICEEPLARGYRVIKNTDGVRNSQTSHSEVMISLDGRARENEGRVIGAALCWGGNYELMFRTDATDYHIFMAGICPDNAEYHLGKGETFTTPPLAYTFSTEGLSGASRNFHRWGRKYRLAHGNTERKILLNSWEGVYLDVNEPEMEQMMSDIASMGGELFVMDDGWFGSKYPRTNDSQGLGDWSVDRNKLPGGTGKLIKTADSYGIDFGIWIEPEMTNSLSELYEKHPDWIIKAPHRDNIYGRGGTQLILDLSNPAVQDFVFSTIDNLLKENPGTDYVKWDANMTVGAHGSQYLKYQSHLNIEYWKGLAKVCDRIRKAYPDITIQTCASGGGRANWGVLPWFDEFWVSDNTDAFQRIYMQWGTSYFFPAMAMASHISAVPNHCVHRTTSLKFRCDVAMSGRLGMEMQPRDMTDDEKAFCREVISNYKKIRPIIQFGDIFRLVSPYEDKGIASMMYVSGNKDSAVFYWWRMENLYDAHYPRVRMHGLDPDRKYRITELNRIDVKPMPIEGKSYTGRFLMENGVEISPVVHDVQPKRDWSSRVLLLEAE